MRLSAKRWIEAQRIRRRPRIGSIATMPSRAATFARVLPTIAPQVDRLYLYLDGFTSVPDQARAYANVVPLLASENGNLRVSGRYLPLTTIERPSVFVLFDDDIAYPPGYVEAIVNGLAQFGGRAVVGYHAGVLRPPFVSYKRDHEVLHFAADLVASKRVDILGAGTAAFDTGHLRFDPRAWDAWDMDDLMIAFESERRGMPRIALARPKKWIGVLDEAQPDSLFTALLKDDGRQSAMMHRLIALVMERSRSADAGA